MAVYRNLLTIKDAHFTNAIARLKTPQYLFQKPVKSFEIKSPGQKKQAWGVMGPRKSDFLGVLAGKGMAEPRLGRVYLTNLNSPGIQYLNFRDNTGLDHVHMSARYESYSFKGVLEMSDDVNSVLNYVTGANNYNRKEVGKDELLVTRLLTLFNLHAHKDKWINSLSNGQRRRARIAKALYCKPLLLVIDDPFLGLDPQATSTVSSALNEAMGDLETNLAMGLRIQDEIPEYITHLAFIDEQGLSISGEKEQVAHKIRDAVSLKLDVHQRNANLHEHVSYERLQDNSPSNPIVEFNNAHVSYKGHFILRNFTWQVARGSRWRISGENGSGKTTILSLITADHPQSWRSVLRVNGILRKSGSGQTYFGINNQIGMTSPELHAVVPFSMTMKEVILNGLIPDIGNMNFAIKYKEQPLTPFAKEVLESFAEYIQPNADVSFGQLSTSLQKLVLFLRASIKNPSILILDEAFSCMDDVALVIKCHEFIENKMSGATVLTIGHIDWEVPFHEKVLKLVGDEARSYEVLEVKRT